MLAERKMPLTLKIAPGRKWTGTIVVKRREADGTYLCAFDAEDPKGITERVVYDVTTMTAARLAEWTGVNLDEYPDEPVAKRRAPKRTR